jgi:hypothetical protein
MIGEGVMFRASVIALPGYEMSDLKIKNDAVSNRFEVLVSGKLAFLDYRIDGHTTFLLYVEVPPAEQGRGIAGRLSRAALEYARDNGLKVVPRCPFIATYVRRHPELLQGGALVR